MEGWITPARAFEVYGVAIDAEGVVDPEATQRRRAALADG
jgi:hypothetical protein